LAPGLHLSGQDVSSGPGFYELYAQDVNRARNEVGASIFRFSLEWSRIFPSDTRGLAGYAALRAVASEEALRFYHAVLAAVRDAGMQPLVTLHHYTLPLWLHDGKACHMDLEACPRRGWLDPDIVEEMARFSGFAAEEFGAEIDLWATQNEPMAVVISGYISPSATRSNPPGVTFRFREAREVMARMQLTHARQYDAVKAGDTVDSDDDGQAARVGLVYAVAPVYPRDALKPGDAVGAQDVDYLFNRAFLNAVMRGDYDEDLDGTRVRLWREVRTVCRCFQN
jgi:beta-glucosidase/6-phospho-beta-glucosidase/beta-galactosidase